jgi:hypothetical protein
MITLAKIVCAWLAEELGADFWTPFIDLASPRIEPRTERHTVKEGTQTMPGPAGGRDHGGHCPPPMHI